MDNRLTVNYQEKPCYDIVFTTDFSGLSSEVESLGFKGRKIAIITDSNVGKIYGEEVKTSLGSISDTVVIYEIPAGEENKQLDEIKKIYEFLMERHFDRHDLLVALGGGVVGDMCGFTAATYLRGISFVQIPTTLLAQSDSSVGGKTGINFNGLKNEIGVFNNAATVILDTQFLRTLDRENILSGYAEMLKHGLISNTSMWAELINFNLDADPLDLATLQRMLADSVAVKQRIVTEDPLEHGLRKALNLGHTVGHAFESFALALGTGPNADVPDSAEGPAPSAKDNSARTPQLHGYFVAFGIVCELYLSVVKTNFPIDKMRQTVSFIREHYGRMPITCDDYPTLFELMTHDKKNTAGIINFTLLGDIGDIRINQTATKEEIYEALDFYREG